jgi:CheY-like chemotaxis protein
MMGKERDDPEYAKLEAVEKSVQMATELTQRLLIFGRKVESNLRPVNLNQEVLQVSKVLERTIPKMISIELRLYEGINIIDADAGQVEQVLMNLGVNARDAMPDGGRLVFETENVTLDRAACKGYLGSASPGDYVLLTVSDTGQGIDNEVLEHIFEPFFTTKEVGKGTGLGLAVVYGIVESHGGYVGCETLPGQGTSFKIYFPVSEHVSEVSRQKEAETPVQGGNEGILLVDDEERIRELGREILTKFGYTVLTAPNGESALELYQEESAKVAVVVLDLIMPGMGGLRCLEGILRLNPGAKVLIASGYSVDGSAKDAVRAGAKGFIAKPYAVRKMLRTIREVLDGE